MPIFTYLNGEFPRAISDQPYNRFIKEVCKKAGLTYKIIGSKKELLNDTDSNWRKMTGKYEKWELVTSHIGRRTFATNHYDKIRASLLAHATGHKSQTIFLKYMRKNNRDMALEIAEYFNI